MFSMTPFSVVGVRDGRSRWTSMMRRAVLGRSAKVAIRYPFRVVDASGCPERTPRGGRGSLRLAVPSAPSPGSSPRSRRSLPSTPRPTGQRGQRLGTRPGPAADQPDGRLWWRIDGEAGARAGRSRERGPAELVVHDFSLIDSLRKALRHARTSESGTPPSETRRREVQRRPHRRGRRLHPRLSRSGPGPRHRHRAPGGSRVSSSALIGSMTAPRRALGSSGAASTRRWASGRRRRSCRVSNRTEHSAWDVSDPDQPSSSWWYELDEEAGGVRLTHGARMGPAPSGLSIAINAMPDKEERIIARRLEEFEANMQRDPRWHQRARGGIGVSLRIGVWATPFSPHGVAFAREAERIGVSSLWVPEVWGYDALTGLAHLAAQTTTIGLGTFVVQLGSRSPALLATSALSLQSLSHGRFHLGVGVSGPQVMEGWHGVRFRRPVQATRETIEIIRTVTRARCSSTTARSTRCPCPTARAAPCGRSVRPTHVPIYIAAMGPANLRLTGEVADGWLANAFIPESAETFLGPLARGRGRGGRSLAELDLVAPVALEITPDDAAGDEAARRHAQGYAFTIGAMGSGAPTSTTTPSPGSASPTRWPRWSGSGVRATRGGGRRRAARARERAPTWWAPPPGRRPPAALPRGRDHHPAGRAPRRRPRCQPGGPCSAARPGPRDQRTTVTACLFPPSPLSRRTSASTPTVSLASPSHFQAYVDDGRLPGWADRRLAQR